MKGLGLFKLLDFTLCLGETEGEWHDFCSLSPSSKLASHFIGFLTNKKMRNKREMGILKYNQLQLAN